MKHMIIAMAVSIAAATSFGGKIIPASECAGLEALDNDMTYVSSDKDGRLVNPTIRTGVEWKILLVSSAIYWVERGVTVRESVTEKSALHDLQPVDAHGAPVDGPRIRLTVREFEALYEQYLPAVAAYNAGDRSPETLAALRARFDRNARAKDNAKAKKHRHSKGEHMTNDFNGDKFNGTDSAKCLKNKGF